MFTEGIRCSSPLRLHLSMMFIALRSIGLVVKANSCAYKRFPSEYSISHEKRDLNYHWLAKTHMTRKELLRRVRK